MKVLFIAYHHLANNSGIHIFNIANHLTQLDVECVVCVPNQKEKVLSVGKPLFEVVNFEDLQREKIKRNIDLIHAWTPREIVRKITQKLLAMYDCPYIVHLEDNEEFLIEKLTKLRVQTLKKVPAFLLNLMIRPHMSHPLRYKTFLENSSGVTIIIEKLSEFVPKNLPRVIIWAGYQDDLHWGMSLDSELKQKLGITNHEFVVVYTGNVHAANQAEVANLYQAVEIINNHGIRVKLIRTGKDYLLFVSPKIKSIKRKYCIELEHLPRSALPSLLSIADVLVQPGKPDRFNAYRFPSKLPEFLASGKPVVLPKTNIGLYLKNQEECILLEEGNAIDITQKLELLFSDEFLRKKIGSGGRRFAEQHLKWEYIAKKLHSFYNCI